MRAQAVHADEPLGEEAVSVTEKSCACAATVAADADAPACCSPQSSCCGAPVATPADYPYSLAAFVIGTLDTAAGPVPQVSRSITRADRRGAWRCAGGSAAATTACGPASTPRRAGADSAGARHRQLQADLRRAARVPRGPTSWLLVVDTHGINVWCAAGKGTFSHRRGRADGRADAARRGGRPPPAVLPQLSAPGVAAHRVKRRSGFRVVFGPLRAADLPAFLAAGMEATPQMRAVTFDLGERAGAGAGRALGRLAAWALRSTPASLPPRRGAGRPR